MLTTLYRYNLSDAILYIICLMPNYLIDLLNPFITLWMVDNILSWFTYVARVMVMSYFSLTPVGYFYYFGLLAYLFRVLTVKCHKTVVWYNLYNQIFTKST